MLDIQPGRSSFIDEVKHLQPWLRTPFVSVALDPEWNMGSTTASRASGSAASRPRWSTR